MEPSLKKSSTDTAEPRRATPRSDTEDARWAKSNTDSEKIEPNLVRPKRDTAEPMRATLRTDKEEPKCRKSSTDIAAPNLAKLLRDIDEPR